MPPKYKPSYAGAGPALKCKPSAKMFATQSKAAATQQVTKVEAVKSESLVSSTSPASISEESVIYTNNSIV